MHPIKLGAKLTQIVCAIVLHKNSMYMRRYLGPGPIAPIVLWRHHYTKG